MRVETHRHAVGFELPLPAGWEVSENVDGCALVAVEPARRDPHLRASVVVTVEVVGDDAAGWPDRSLAAVRESLIRYRLIDDEELEIGGRRARRVLRHNVHAGVGGVNLEVDDPPHRDQSRLGGVRERGSRRRAAGSGRSPPGR